MGVAFDVGDDGGDSESRQCSIGTLLFVRYLAVYIKRTRDVRSGRSASRRPTLALVSGRSKVALVDGDSPHLTGQARGRLRCRAAHLRARGVGSGSLGPK